MIFIANLSMIFYGIYLNNQVYGSGEKIVGAGVLVFCFIFLPLFLYYRYRNKNIEDYIYKD
tara:strand:- start:322 stop:504 length:183 start_codon:yes stop_codon:yes gene_type:complete